MKDSNKKPSHTEDTEGRPDGWVWFMAAQPMEWIVGLIALGIIAFFGVPDEFRRAVYYVTVIFVMMFGSVVLVYIFARSLKRGDSAPGSDGKRRED